MMLAKSDVLVNTQVWLGPGRIRPSFNAHAHLHSICHLSKRALFPLLCPRLLRIHLLTSLQSYSTVLTHTTSPRDRSLGACCPSLTRVSPSFAASTTAVLPLHVDLRPSHHFPIAHLARRHSSSIARDGPDPRTRRPNPPHDPARAPPGIQHGRLASPRAPPRFGRRRRSPAARLGAARQRR